MTRVDGNAAGGPALAVLVSGGLDSAILAGTASRQRASVQPLYVRSGLSWEATELRHLRGFLEAIRTPALLPLQLLEMPVADLYGDHWSISGQGVPGAETPDEAVFLPGRNVLLLTKALLWCQLHGIGELGLAPLASNPFPDATPEFFNAFEAVVNRAVGGAVRLWLPYAGLHKIEVMRLGRDLPLALTFSCIRPSAGRHCGACNKCAERRRAFADVGRDDATDYAQPAPS